MKTCPVCSKSDFNDASYLCPCGHALRDIRVGFTLRQVLDALGAPMASDVHDDNPATVPTMLVYPPQLVILFEGGRVTKIAGP
jgi:hypothetical protein